MFVENSIMTRTEELPLFGNPADTAAKVRAYIRHRMIGAPILRENIDTYFLFVFYPTGLAGHLGLKSVGEPNSMADKEPSHTQLASSF
jgi:hypothetical protein